MSRGMTRAERLRELERLYTERGYTDIEMADRLGVDRTTVYKDRLLLEAEVPFVEVEPGRWKINRTRYLSAIRLNLHEALALYLAARRMSRQTRMAQTHVASALEKLAAALRQPMTEKLVQAASTILKQPARPERVTILETIAQGWIEQLKVRITHRSLHARRSFTYTVAPYLIEPSLWSDGAYVIGHSDVHGGIATFKVERIENAVLTTERFVIPDDFDERELLQHAWGIWYSDSEPVTVKLRFMPGEATRRVKESIWHPSQQIEDTPDGGCIWIAQVAEWQEMVPWIRGWGADVEVLAPQELREAMMKEARRLALVYHLAIKPTQDSSGGEEPMDIFQQFLTLAGKTEPRLTIFEHSSDVFHAAIYLLTENKAAVRSPHLVKAGALLHDVGKIEQDVKVGKQWNHQPYSARYLRPLLEHPRMKALLTDNDIDLTKVNYDDLLLICEHHHDIPTQPVLLRRCPDALLVSVADIMASALESGWLGDIKEMLSASTYIDLNLSLLENLGLDGGLDSEIHRVDLPGDSVADALLNDLIFRDMSKRLPNHGLKPILQKGGSLWVIGGLETLRVFLKDYVVNPRILYESADLADEIYDGVLAAMPRPGAVQMDTIKYLLVNEQIARKVMLGLVDRKRVRQALEHFDISLHSIHETFGVRGRTVADKLEAVGETLRYLMAGAQAAYYYHGWRTPPAGEYELLIDQTDFDTWYSYLRDSRIFVGKKPPTAQEREHHAETVMLMPELTTELWENRVWIDDVAYIAPTDLLFRLIAAQTEATVGEALAILVARRQVWDWGELVSIIKGRRMARQLGCLFEVLNLEASQPVVPVEAIEPLFAVVQDTVGEAVFTFPLRAGEEGLPPGRVPDEYTAIGLRWGIELLLPRHLVTKVLDDLEV